MRKSIHGNSSAVWAAIAMILSGVGLAEAVPVSVVATVPTDGEQIKSPIASEDIEDCDGNGIPDEREIAVSRSIEFDGVDDYAVVPHTPVLEPEDELTIEAWVRADTSGSYHSRIVRTSNDFASGYILAWQQAGDQRAQLRIDSAGGRQPSSQGYGVDADPIWANGTTLQGGLLGNWRLCAALRRWCF